VNIRQLNASYVVEEDRVLLRFTTLRNEEYRLWLTRAVMGSMMQLAANLLVRSVQRDPGVPQASAMLASKQSVPQGGAPLTRFEGSAQLPLGAEPVLVKLVQASSVTDQGFSEVRHPVLLLQLARSQSLKLRLNEDLTRKLQLLMQRMNEVAAWDLRATLPEKTGQLVRTEAEKLALLVEDDPQIKVLH